MGQSQSQHRPLAMELTDLDISGTEEHIAPQGHHSNTRPRSMERKSQRTLNPLADRPTRRLLYLSMLAIYCLFVLAADVVFVINKSEIDKTKDMAVVGKGKTGTRTQWFMQHLALIPSRLIWELLGSCITLLCCLAVIFFYETDLIVMGRDFFAEEFFHFLAGSLFIGSIVFWASGSIARVDTNTQFIVTSTTTRVVYTSFQILLLCGELLSPLFNNENIRFLVRAMLNFYVCFDEFVGLLYLSYERQEIFFLVAVAITWISILAGLTARLAHISVRKIIRFPVISVLMFGGACCYVIAMCIHADKVQTDDVNYQTALRFYLVTWGLFYFMNLIIPAIDNAMYVPKPQGGFEMLNDEFELELDEDLPLEMSGSGSQHLSKYMYDPSREVIPAGRTVVTMADDDEEDDDGSAGVVPRQQSDSGPSLEDVDLDESLEDDRQVEDMPV